MIPETEFAQECVFRGLFFGVNPHYLLGVAKLRSDIKDDSEGNLIGPFRLTQAEWDANSSNLEFGLKYRPDQISSWRRQCGVFGLMTYVTQNALHLKLSRYPSAVELYVAQWPATETTTIAARLKTALDATAALVEPAANAILDDPSEADNILIDANKATVTKPPSGNGGLFETKAPRIMRQLMDDFAFTKIQTAGVLGNLGHETGGFKHFQELAPISGQGGFGWAQWTGPRRRDFMNFCQANGLSPTSDDANYGFLRHELNTSERNTVPALKAESTLEGATRIFEQLFERAGIVALNSRIKFARKALAAFENLSPA
jgi:hypothetical protein